MKKNTSFTLLMSAFAAATLMVSCKKTETTIPPAQAHFAASGYQGYYIRNEANSSFNVVVGTTNVTNSDREINVKVTSARAVLGTQYTLPATKVVIPAGQATANFVINGKFSEYATGRKDTLVVTLAEPSVVPAKFLDTVRVVLQRYCDVSLTALAGNYPRTFEGEGNSYGPYTSALTNVTSTGATTATARLLNLYDSGIPVPVVKFNWTNPANFTVTIDEQYTGFTSGGNQIWIRTVGTSNTFSSCDNTVSFRYDLIAKNAAGATLGYYELNFPMVMGR